MSYYSDFQRQRQSRGHYVSGGEPVEVARKLGQTTVENLTMAAQAIGHGFAKLAQHRARRSAIAALRSLPSATLRDIGIERGEITRVVRDLEQGRDPRRSS